MAQTNFPTGGTGQGGGNAPAGGSTGLTPNVASLLSYICMPITSIVFLLVEKENLDVKFHAWQGTIFGVGYIAFIIAIQILAAIFGMIWSVFGIIFSIFIPLFGLAAFVLWLVCLVKAYQGERWKMPIVGEYAAKKAGITA